MSLNFDLPKDAELTRKVVREFAEKEIAPIAQELDDKEEFSYDLTRKMGELDFFGPFVSEEYGGSDVGYLNYIIIVEEIARIDGSQAATIAAGNSLGIAPIYYFGTEEQKRKWLPDLCKGKILASFGLTEPDAGSDAGASRTTAVLDGNEWVINGSKIFITNSTTDMSAVCVVQCVTDRSDAKKARGELHSGGKRHPRIHCGDHARQDVLEIFQHRPAHVPGLPCPQGQPAGAKG